MNWIAIQSYFKVHRVMSDGEQTTVEHIRSLYLYEHKVLTQYREFPIDEVFDMSFRNLGADGGFLYLYTKQGVFPYTVKVDPSEFIVAFKGLKGSCL
jgi:hypothetical protein